MKTETFGLHEVPPPGKFATHAAEREYDAICLRNNYVRSKLDRHRRMAEKQQYIFDYCPEIISGQGGVLDIGCADGVFLELCRMAGHAVHGIDVLCGQGGMGDDYCKAAQLLASRQHVPVDYCGFDTWLKADDRHVAENSLLLINFQGSFLMCHVPMGFVDGEPHHVHHDTKQLEWIVSIGLKRHLAATFRMFRTLLLPDGCVLLVMNESKNQAEFVSILDEAIVDAGYRITRNDTPCVRKYQIVPEEEPEDDKPEQNIDRRTPTVPVPTRPFG